MNNYYDETTNDLSIEYLLTLKGDSWEPTNESIEEIPFL